MFNAIIDHSQISPADWLTNSIARHLAASKVPTRVWQRIDSLPVFPTEVPEQAAWYEREMIASKVIFDTSKLRLRTENIEKFLRKHVQVPDELWETVQDVLGNIVARDPNSHGFKGAGRQPDLAKIEQAWYKGKAKLTPGVPGNEGFVVGVTSTAKAAYNHALATKDTAFLAEVHGLLWRQLHL